MIEKKMFYKANPLIFARAKGLRKNMTAAEILLWGYLKTDPFGYKFRRQHPLGIYIADFFSYKLKLVIEVDGEVHNNDNVKLNDEKRQQGIESDGIEVIRFKNEEVMKTLEVVMEKINLAIENKLLNTNEIPPLGG